MSFSTDERALLELPAFAALTTLQADGAPHTTVMWYRQDGDVLRMIAPAAAKKVRNMSRDARVTVVVIDPANGYHYLELRGRAEIVSDDAAARAELPRIAARYIGDRASGYTAQLSSDPRVLILIHPESLRYHAGKPPG